MMILIRDVKGNELKLSHGSDVYMKALPFFSCCRIDLDCRNGLIILAPGGRMENLLKEKDWPI